MLPGFRTLAPEAVCMTPLDWSLVAAMLAVMLAGLWLSRGAMRGVADFLAAGRSAGRYVLTVATGLAGLGAITIVANLEMNYVAGFSMAWWELSMRVVLMVIAVSGWVVYRFRETRCLTLAEFFERRYSRRFRVFAGLLAWISGIVNFGIFPSVGARFFIHYCGLPDEVLGLPTYAVTMFGLISLSLLFVFVGGQVSVIVTDFIQGLFVNIVFIWLVLHLMTQVSWDQIYAALGTAPENASLINPFKTSHVADFNFWYFLIGVGIVIYGPLSWQGTQGYNASARDAHEAKMGAALALWRTFPQFLALFFVPVVAYTVMHHGDFAGVRAVVEAGLSGAETDATASQLRVPLVLMEMLPVGLLGAFAAVMMAAFVSTHDTYLHSWGSIFIQDVVMPFRKTPLSPKAHLRVLRLSIVGVALFIFLFSLLFTQTDYIMMFFAITGAIFTGGSGAVIIGGLYWRRGTAAGAWAALCVGSGLAVTGIVLQQVMDDFPLNGQVMTAISMGGAVLAYVLGSLLSRQTPPDLDKLLHRGEWRVDEDHERVESLPTRGWRMLGMGKEFSRGDRVIYLATYTWILGWFAVFVVGTVWNLTSPVDDGWWQGFWKVFVGMHAVLAVVVTAWLGLGGLRDVKAMLIRLRTMGQSTEDDGFIRREPERE